HYSAVSIEDESFEAFFRPISRTTEAGKKELRIVDLPPGVNHNQQIVTIGGQHLLELAFEIPDALVELVNVLDGRGPLKLQSWLLNGPRGLAKSSHHRHFGRAHLEGEKQKYDH